MQKIKLVQYYEKKENEPKIETVKYSELVHQNKI